MMGLEKRILVDRFFASSDETLMVPLVPGAVAGLFILQDYNNFIIMDIHVHETLHEHLPEIVLQEDPVNHRSKGSQIHKRSDGCNAIQNGMNDKFISIR